MYIYVSYTYTPTYLNRTDYVDTDALLCFSEKASWSKKDSLIHFFIFFKTILHFSDEARPNVQRLSFAALLRMRQQPGVVQRSQNWEFHALKILSQVAGVDSCSVAPKALKPFDSACAHGAHGAHGAHDAHSAVPILRPFPACV